jgi:histidine ammonia-lyase
VLTLTDRSDFTIDAYRRVAWEGKGVTIAPEALERIAARRASMEELVASAPDRHFYGTTTRPGEGVKSILSAEGRRDYESRFAAPPGSYGDPVPERVARGIVFTRLINFIEGHAGVRAEFAAAVAEYLDGRPLGELPSRGHAWEVMVLPHLLPGFVETFGALAAKEPMAISNGCPAGTALLVDLTLAGRRRVALAELAMALGAEAVLSPHEHYAPEIEELWLDPHEGAALRRTRELLEGGAPERRPFQAPVSYRIVPRMLGVANRSQAAAEEASSTMLRAVSDNPVYVPPAEGRPLGDIWSTGGYHPAQAIQAMDGLAYAWANLCQLVYHQSARIADDEFALGGAVDRPRGPMGQAAWAYEMRELAQPTLLPLTGTKQTDAGSMSFAAWRKATEIGRGLDAMLAGLAVAASEAFDVTGRPVPPRLEEFLAFVRSHRPPNGARETLGSDVGALADAMTATVYSAETRLAGAAA